MPLRRAEIAERVRGFARVKIERADVGPEHHQPAFGPDDEEGSRGDDGKRHQRARESCRPGLHGRRGQGSTGK
jgi:hypothetical protein